MNLWTKILPFFFVEWFSKKYLSTNILGDKRIVSPFKGIFIQVGDKDD